MEAWKRILESGRRKAETADRFRRDSTAKIHLRAWATHVRELEAERNRKSLLCRRRQLQKQWFLAWRSAKEESLQLEVKARQMWATALKRKAFAAWGEWVYGERLKGWEAEKRADRHFDHALVRKVLLRGFKQLPVIARRERERETRKELLRRKVAHMLPDFTGS